MVRTILLFFVLASAAAIAQPFSFGVKIGAPLNEAYDIATSSNRNYFSDTTQYTVGASAEVRLPAGVSVEGDLLYTRFHFSTENLLNVLSKANSNAFEFPIVVKYHPMSVGPLHPFVGAGPSFRSIQSILRYNPRTTNDSFGKGVVVAGGVEIKVLLLRITPELRYTHWGSQSFLDGANTLVRAKQSQGQFLVGISF